MNTTVTKKTMKVLVLNNFAVGQTHLGQSVFAARSFRVGDVITQFTGETFHKSEIPKRYKGEDDRFVQIGQDQFMGPSGGVDDLINHSCDPNSGLKFNSENIYLVALKDIAEGDEITWDYSTTMFENNWKMKCDCKSGSCRKIIGDFSLLDRELQQKYKELNVIPQYIKDYMDSPEYPVYTEAIEQMKLHGKTKR
ncbi:MAG: Proteins containing SET domain [Parcubacteria bacterium C7867-007]|nr:MAG: Proteins containing SET domain [Parcubacteria bacterium C7867-007]